MSEKKNIIFLEVEAKPVTEEITIKQKIIDSIEKQYSDGTDEGKLMKKLMPQMLASMPEELFSGSSISFDGMTTNYGGRPRMMLMLDEEELQKLDIKLGDLITIEYKNLSFEKRKSKSSEKSSQLVS